MDMQTGLAIEAVGLQKSYGNVTVLRGVDLAVPAGSVVALLGPNGAGKTTTVRILATLLRPDGGRARVAGHDIIHERHLVRRGISLTGQFAAIDELQTGAENLRMMGRLRGLTARDAWRRANTLLAQFDLLDAGNRRAGTYSGGMRRRLDLAASLVVPPAVLFLDEPTTGLDPRSRQDMWQVVMTLVGTGVTVLLTTQYLEEADRLADRIAVLDNGRLIAEGTPSELKRTVAGQRLDLTLSNDADVVRVALRLGDRVIWQDPAQRFISLATSGDAGHIRDLLDEIDPARTLIEQFNVRTASLDDVYLTLTGHAAATKEVAHV